MRRVPLGVVSASLCFDRAGRQLIVAEPDAISLVEIESGRAVRLPIQDARAVAGFESELWIATHEDKLVRVAYDGTPLGAPEPLPFSARAAFVPAPCGSAAAIWGSLPHVALVESGGEITRTELGADADAVLPLSGRRALVARGTQITLPSGAVTPLAPNTRVLGGGVLADGKLAALLVAAPGGYRLLALSLGTGHIIQQCTMPSATVRIATRRGIAIALLEPRQLWAFELRTGREICAATFERDIADIALDPDGRRLVVRGVGGEIEVHELADLQQARARGEVTAEPVADVSIDEPAPVVVETAPAAPPPPTATTITVPVLRALEPRDGASEIDRAQARRQLALELQRVALWSLAAIANAWDTRRIGYGNEGKHPFELEVAAILGLNQGFAGDYVATARELLTAHEAAIAADPLWRGPGTPVAELCTELGLSARAIDIVMVIAAAALLGEISRLYGILSNDAARAGVDELLVQQVLAGRHDRHDLAAELDPRAPLVRLGIVHSAGKRRPFSELSLDPVVLDRLRAVAPELGAAITLRADSCELAALDLSRPVLDAALAALARPPTAPVRIAVRGRVGSGRRSLLAALTAAAGRTLAVIDAQALPRRADAFVDELATVLRRIHLAGHVPCLVHLADVTFDEAAGRDVAAETLRLHPGPIAIVTAPDLAVPFAAGHVAIDLPVLAEGERRAVWEKAFAEASVEPRDLDTLAARYRIGPGLIRQAVGAARAATGDASEAIHAFVRQTRDARLGQYARRVERLASWSTVVLPPDILDSLRELIARVRHGRTVFETWGMIKTMATSRGLTALFSGPPGTGKTLVAGVIARELGLDLYQVDLSKVMSKWIGETERNLSTIFDAAEDGQVVLLFDEADSLFAKRTEVRSSNDRYANLEVNYLLQRLDTFEGIAILTTNTSGSIDQAFKRRMSFRLSFPFPDEETRAELWRAHLPPELPIAGGLELDSLARKYQLSGGYIRNACLRAAFLAAQDETMLHQRHLERAVALEFAELGKLSSGGTID